MMYAGKIAASFSDWIPLQTCQSFRIEINLGYSLFSINGRTVLKSAGFQLVRPALDSGPVPYIGGLSLLLVLVLLRVFSRGYSFFLSLQNRHFQISIGPATAYAASFEILNFFFRSLRVQKPCAHSSWYCGTTSSQAHWLPEKGPSRVVPWEGPPCKPIRKRDPWILGPLEVVNS